MEYIVAAALGFLSCSGLVIAFGIAYLVLRTRFIAQPVRQPGPHVITRKIEWGSVRWEIEAYRSAGWRILTVKNGLPGDKLVELLLEHD